MSDVMKQLISEMIEKYIKESDDIRDLPVKTLSPYEGADVGYAHTNDFPGSPGSAQMFAKYAIQKGMKAKIGRRGNNYFVFTTKFITKQDWLKTNPFKVGRG